MTRRALVTGAFSYTGAAVARELMRRGWQVHTLTQRSPPQGETRITSAPLHFDDKHLEAELRGADVFVNTFWVRLPWGGQTFDTAVAQSTRLLDAAARAGVGRIVHVSVSNAEVGSSLGYYRGKADVERVVRQTGRSYAIVRPTLIVGASDVLSNNIAWFLRRFPLFPLPRGGKYRLQPITEGDVGVIIADAAKDTSNFEIDAAGPEIFTFADYVRLLGAACGATPIFCSVPNWVALGALKIVEPFLGDIVLTREELLGLEQELLLSSSRGLGRTSVSDWLKKNGQALGRSYVNDLRRHFGAERTRPIASGD